MSLALLIVLRLTAVQFDACEGEDGGDESYNSGSLNCGTLCCRYYQGTGPACACWARAVGGHCSCTFCLQVSGGGPTPG